MMRIDLHTHSKVSDGTDSPAELVAKAAQAGLDVVGLTDHDTTAGWAEATKAAEQCGIGLVLGSEFSTTWQGQSVHLLSYFHSPNHVALASRAQDLRESRVGRAQQMCARLAADFPITWQDVQAQASQGGTIGRPHMADALVAAGVFSSREAAFSSVLNSRSAYYVPHQQASTVEMIGLVRAAG
ncbi:MAG: PHP domain-containing protein, partial [Bifidobacteriaceae bacterium]|nr:PHP domain-containing protein [Bifidobacteriaceae bacterium]